MTKLEDLVSDHEPDVAWITALWLAIHGGDPAPGERVDVKVDETTMLLAAALSARLSDVHGLGPVSIETVQERMAAMGVTIRQAGTDPEAPELDTETNQGLRRAVWKCVFIGGNTGWCCNVVGYEE